MFRENPVCIITSTILVLICTLMKIPFIIDFRTSDYNNEEMYVS